MSKEQMEFWVNVSCLTRHRYFKDPVPQTSGNGNLFLDECVGGMTKFSSDCYVNVGSVCKSE